VTLAALAKEPVRWRPAGVVPHATASGAFPAHGYDAEEDTVRGPPSGEQRQTRPFHGAREVRVVADGVHRRLVFGLALDLRPACLTQPSTRGVHLPDLLLERAADFRL
jgi:hypothetical protein